MAQQQPNQNQIQIRAKDEDLKGTYSNAMQVSHTKEEFVLDFYSISPQGNVGTLVSKVILSPGHTKRMIGALEENLKRYEDQFGDIETAEAPTGGVGFQAEK